MKVIKGAYKMPIYNKLVRDKIPQIIEKDGKSLSKKILFETEYLIAVNEKMQEEIEEYYSSTSNEESLEELADLLELIHAASKALGASINEVEKIREKKARKRGGFEEGIFLIEVEDD